ncbi:MAG: dihydroorotase [Candidatus Cloacimonadia bacterium]|jgi:dihydroorotase
MLVKNGLVYQGDKFEKLDVLIKGTKIERVAPSIDETEATKIIDAEGKHVFPGFVDLHTHLRDPGQTHKEDIISGTKAAAKGGYTTICAMPNTDPIVDNIATVEYIKRKAKDVGYCKVSVIGALTKKSEGKELTEVASMLEGGIVAVSDDGGCVQNTKIKLNAMKYVSNFNIPVIVHAEDYSLSAKGQINAGTMSTKLGLGGIPALAEEIIISRDIMLAENLNCHLHIAHISTAKAIQMVREAKSRGVKVTCEVTPHHLLLTEDACDNYDTNTKVKPPLRTKKDRLACLEGLLDDTIDFIASDHAPHSDFEKEKEFNLAPFGINVLETSFASLYTGLVMENKIELTKLIEKLSTSPAKFLKINSGLIKEGCLADITVVDLEGDIHFSAETMVSKSNNTPFINQTFKGRVDTTICDGVVTWGAGTKS